ncbi:MAG TPA: hypothetical protein VF597_03630 [Candidatus Saccharimonadales bacterium]|jgi:hypothetical protein
MGFFDPMSKEKLRNIGDRRRRGERVSDNEIFELDKAKRAGVKDIEPKK